MEMKNETLLRAEMLELKGKQKEIIKARFLDVAELNKVNKRLYEIRQALHQMRLQEKQQEELYIF